MSKTGDVVSHDPDWAAKAQVRRVKAFCPHGVAGTCDACVTKLLDENDSLRAVLHDALEEKGFTDRLVAIEDKLKLSRRALKEGSFATMYGNQNANGTALGQAMKHLGEAMLQLRDLTGTGSDLSFPSFIPMTERWVEEQRVPAAYGHSARFQGRTVTGRWLPDEPSQLWRQPCIVCGATQGHACAPTCTSPRPPVPAPLPPF